VSFRQLIHFQAVLKKPEIIGFLLCYFCTFVSKGQELPDSVRILEPVVIMQSRLTDHKIAAYQLPVDSSMLSLASSGSVTDLLRKQGLGHLRSYGPGGLALPSFRGTGSSHTVVLWDGIDLVSPLSGQLDLSLVPATLFDDATLETGGSSSLSGSGSIGGSIQFTNKVKFGEGLRITASSHYGSFGTMFADAGVHVSKKRFGMTTKLFVTESKNDFKYLDTSVMPVREERRQHSAFDQHGVLQHLFYQSKSIGIFSLKLWYQKSNYEIPNPIGIRSASEATEENQFYRAIAKWNYSKNKLNINYQSAFVGQQLGYADPVKNQFSRSRYLSVVQDLETDYQFSNRSQLTSGVRYTWEKGIVDDFGNTVPERNRVALFAAYKIQFLKWDFSLSAREELINGKPKQFAPTISAKYSATKQVNLFTNLSSNYRIPTFNDLYWKGTGATGNPDLITEESVSGEVGFGYQKGVLSFRNVIFTNYVDDWIQWTPDANQVWTPQNIKKVWSRGLESQVKVEKKTGDVFYGATAQYSYTKSTNESIYTNGNVNETGKQLLLTPVHEGSLSVNAEWKGFGLRVVNSYTGEQFNDSDNTDQNIVDDYLITNIWLTKTLNRRNVTATFIAEINNSFDVMYVARPGYPLPGRNYKAGIQFTFNKSKRP
jgi:vitamin B12 transporter